MHMCVMFGLEGLSP